MSEPALFDEFLDDDAVLDNDAILNAEIAFDPRCTIVTLHGRVACTTTEGIADVDAVLDLACQAGPDRVMVDLNHATHVDAGVLAAILAFRRRVPRTTVTVDVSSLPGPRLMDLMAEVLDPTQRSSVGP